MPTPILLIAETENGALRKGSLQALGEAARLAKLLGGSLSAVAIGKPSDASRAGLAAHGVAEVAALSLDEKAARNSGVLAAAIAARAPKDGLTFLSLTDLAAEVAPRLATRLGVAYFADVTAIESAPDGIVVTRPIYAGKASEKLSALTPGAVLTLRANAFPTPDLASAPAGAGAQIVDLAANPAAAKALVRDIVKKSGLDSISLTEADIIVSGGIGVGGPEGYEPLKDLCKVLNAALGASRAAVHAGWISPDNQVGQTGKTVSPNLYIACGISGAIQHQAGMRTSRCIVAINTDANAPIFQIAHYGIVGDVKTVVPMLTAEFRKVVG